MAVNSVPISHRRGAGRICWNGKGLSQRPCIVTTLTQEMAWSKASSNFKDSFIDIDHRLRLSRVAALRSVSIIPTSTTVATAIVISSTVS